MSNRFSKEQVTGTFYAILAFAFWGILPLFWKLLIAVPAWEILAHRIIWAFIFVGSLLVLKGKLKIIKQILKHRKKLLFIIFCSILLGFNWFIYVYAINSNQIIEASLGYYINPLFSILLGLLILKEKINFWQIISLFLASSGVLIIAIQYGKVPWIALSLTLTFGLYGLIKKISKIDSFTGLCLETMMILPAALLFLIYLHLNGTGSFLNLGLDITLLLICSGVVTALPLLWFAMSTKRIPLSRIGFIHFLSPTLTLIIGVVIFKEIFSLDHLLSFSFIWLALIIYTLSHFSFMLKFQPAYFRKQTLK